MAEVTIEHVPPRIKDAFNKGFIALERGNLDYAIDLLSSCVEQVPGFLQARKFLRAAEIQQFKGKKSNSFSRLTSGVSSMPQYFTAMATLKAGKFDQALEMSEKLLRGDPLSLRNLMFFAESASAAGLPEAAVQTLEVASEYHPNDPDILRWMGVLYTQLEQPKQAREALEKLCEMRPNDPSALKALKDASARESMAKDGWGKVAQKGSSIRDVMKDSKEAELLEQKDKAVKTDKDVDALIEDTLARMEKEPENLNYQRTLARLYTQRKAFDQAVAVLKKATELAPGDPELANAMTQTRVAEFDSQIEQLRESGDEAGAEAKEQAKSQFLFDDLNDRVKRYPNDPRLRYEFGVMLFENEYHNEAIQQLQIAQRSPKHRVKALYYLAMCFKLKKQYDMAVDQLEKANAELVTMDDVKKDVVYELGEINEAMGHKDKAAVYFKLIYQVDIGYKDIAAKVERGYNQ